MTQYLNDTFTGTDGTNLTAHTGETGASWAILGTGPTPQIFSNAVGIATSGFSIHRNSAIGSDPNCYTEAIFRRGATATTASTGILCRVDSSVQTGYLALYDDATLSWQLYRANSGTFTQLGSSVSDTLSSGVNKTVRLASAGSGATVSLTLTVDGVTKITYNDTSGSRITAAGYAGLWFNNATTVVLDSITGDAGSAALSIGAIALGTVTSSAIGVTVGAASGGTSPYTYEWRRLANAADVFTSGTVVGTNSTTLSDTGASPGILYHYQCRVTDNATATSTSTTVGACLKDTTLVFGSLGDSIANGFGLSVGQKPGDYAASYLTKLPTIRTATVVNQGVNNTKTSDWTIDSSGTNLFIAKAAFSSAGVTHVHIMLGANDAAAHVTTATYGANLSTICSNLVTAGYKVILSYPTYIPVGANGGATDAAAVDLAIAYHTQIDVLINGTTILRGDTESWKYFALNLSEYQSDLTHPTNTGSSSLGLFWANAIAKVVTLGSSSVSITLTLVNVSGTTQNNLTNLKWSWWDEITPNLLLLPTDKGTIETTDSSGVITISLPNSKKSSGQTGWLIITNSDGNAATNHKCFSGPVVIN